jgi:hypothetical protein
MLSSHLRLGLPSGFRIIANYKRAVAVFEKKVLKKYLDWREEVITDLNYIVWSFTTCTDLFG